MVARQLVKSEIFEKPAMWLKIFLFLLIEAQHEPYKQLKRGQCYTTYAVITKACKASKSEIDHAIRYMKKAHMLATQRATRGMVVSICNYETYQNPKSYRSDSPRDSEATGGPFAATQKRHDKVRMEECINKTGIILNPMSDLREAESPEQWRARHGRTHGVT